MWHQANFDRPHRLPNGPSWPTASTGMLRRARRNPPRWRCSSSTWTTSKPVNDDFGHDVGRPVSARSPAACSACSATKTRLAPKAGRVRQCTPINGQNGRAACRSSFPCQTLTPPASGARRRLLSSRRRRAWSRPVALEPVSPSAAALPITERARPARRAGTRKSASRPAWQASSILAGAGPADWAGAGASRPSGRGPAPPPPRPGSSPASRGPASARTPARRRAAAVRGGADHPVGVGGEIAQRLAAELCL